MVTSNIDIEKLFKTDIGISSNIDWVEFQINNWYEMIEHDNYCLQKISGKNAAIWLSEKGDIVYRIHPLESVCISSARKASAVLSNLLREKIIIDDKSVPTIYMFLCKISIIDLLLVGKEFFDPYENNEFVKYENIVKRNTFLPSPYFVLKPPPPLNVHYSDEKYQTRYRIENNPRKSIIINYILYLAGYHEYRFNYIMNWLSSFFKNLRNRSSIPLVLIGGEKSGIDIFFNEIIKPLFGDRYCIKITDDYLQITNNLYEEASKKLFYNFNNISCDRVEKKEIGNFLSSFFKDNSNTITLKGKDGAVREEIIYGQVLITVNTQKVCLPYIKNGYENLTIFKVFDDIENSKLRLQGGVSFKQKKVLVDEIRNNLKDFSELLRRFKNDPSKIDRPCENDDKHLILQNLDDKVKAFADAIMNKEMDYFQVLEKQDPDLYSELMKDFDQNKIKQSNLIKIFHSIYETKEIEARSLMAKLRKIDNDFFSTDAIMHGSGGVKYFGISS